MSVKLIIEIDDAEFAAKLAGAASSDYATGVLADAGMTRDTPQGAPRTPQSDPWDEPATDAPASRPAAAQASSARPAARTVTVTTAKGKQQWTLGADRAPECACGEPAAYVVGATNGKTWKRWACAKGSGDDWRNKCDFSEWQR